MKAKEAYEKLNEVLSERSSTHQTEEELNNILKEFVSDVTNLINTRHAMSYTAKKSIVLEVNNKWKTVVRLCQAGHNMILKECINDDMFKNILLKEIPSLANYLKDAKVIKMNSASDQQEIGLHIIPALTPLNMITDENIRVELISCMAAAGNYFEQGITISMMAPLLHRIKFLQYWMKNGINYDEIEPFEKDRREFTKNINL